MDTGLRQLTEAFGFFLLFHAATSCCVGTARCVPHVCRQAQDFLHHGLYGQVTLQLLVETPQVQFLDKGVMFSTLAPLRKVPGSR